MLKVETLRVGLHASGSSRTPLKLIHTLETFPNRFGQPCPSKHVISSEGEHQDYDLEGDGPFTCHSY